MEDWSARYQATCKEVAAFLDLPLEVILDKELKKIDRNFFLPSYHVEVSLQRMEQKRYIACPEILQMPVIGRLIKPAFDWLMHRACRRAAHYSVLEHCYNDDPEAAHRLLAKENRQRYGLYAKLNFLVSLAPKYEQRREDLQTAIQLLEKEKLQDHYEQLFEKAIHFSAITPGLKDSFSVGNNLLRNIALLSMLKDIYFIAKGGSAIVRDFPFEEMSRDIEAMYHDGVRDASLGILSLSASLLFLVHYGYTNKTSLTPKNMANGFTPKERRYLLAFPKDNQPLEKRCEDLRSAGFNL